jgi:hypothetical protein
VCACSDRVTLRDPLIHMAFGQIVPHAVMDAIR